MGCVWAMQATSLETLVAARVLQGFGASGPKIASRALIRDRFEGDLMARIMSLIFVIFMLVPMLAPAMGQLVLMISSWEGIFVLFIVWAALCALWLGLRQPETLTPDKRAPLSLRPLLSNSMLILGHPSVMALALAAGLIFGATLLYIGLAQAIFTELYDEGTRFPLWFAVLAIAIAISAFVNGKLVMRFGAQRLTTLALIGLTGLAATHFAVALAYGGIPPFPVFMTLAFAMFVFLGSLFGNINALAMRSLGRIAGLGASLVGAVSSLVSVALSTALAQFHDQTILPLVAGFLFAGVAALLLVQLAARSDHGDV